CDGVRREQPASHVISTMPVTHLVDALTPAVPEKIRASSLRLKYRDFLTVALILDPPQLFPDNWIYIPDPSVRVGRIPNFKNWSPDMVPDPSLTCLGLEYFCSEGDDLWRMSDEALVALGAREVDAIGISGGARVVDATVVRVLKAYPVYDETYQQALADART